MRCNLQIEGSGAKPDDVLIDAGKGYDGKGNKPGAKPGGTRPTDCPTARRARALATPSTSSCAPTAPTASSAATS